MDGGRWGWMDRSQKLQRQTARTHIEQTQPLLQHNAWRGTWYTFYFSFEWYVSARETHNSSGLRLVLQAAYVPYMF